VTNTDRILMAFQQFGYRITLGQALAHPWGYKFCSRLSDLRKKGYRIDCIKAEKASDNLYVMEIPPDASGQTRFL
jgi:hypothetical protein